MRTIDEIHEEIERLSEERTELWHKLSDHHDQEVRAEIHEIDAQLDRLWDEHRALRARLRFGDRDSIVARKGGGAPRARRLSSNPPLH
jgi:ABC-type phosphate transport system auxiliary subunit